MKFLTFKHDARVLYFHSSGVVASPLLMDAKPLLVGPPRVFQLGTLNAGLLSPEN